MPNNGMHQYNIRLNFVSNKGARLTFLISASFHPFVVLSLVPLQENKAFTQSAAFNVGTSSDSIEEEKSVEEERR